MSIKLKIGPTTSFILRANQILLGELADLCSYQKIAENKQKYSKACSEGGWDGRVSVLNKFTGAVPTGLVPRIVAYLRENDHEIEFEKALPISSENPKMSHFQPLDLLRDYQQDAVRAMLHHKRGVVEIPTGGGKTESAVGVFMELKRNLIFFVHTEELLAQAKARFEKHVPGFKVGTIGGGVIDPGPVTIASIQTVSGWLIPPKEPARKTGEFDTDFIARREKYELKLDEWNALNARAILFLGKFGSAIFDECQHLAADTFFACAQACTGAEYLFALSATPWRDDGAEILIEAGSGKVIYSISMSELIERGYLLPADVHVHDYPPLPPMNLSNSYAEQYRICITENEGRNEKIMEVCKSEYERGAATLILCREIKHIGILHEILEFEGIPHGVLHGKSKNRAQVLSDFKSGVFQVLLASGVLDEGADVPRLDTVILAGAGRSRVKVYQRLGRSVRLFEGKSRATIHDFRDEMKPFYYHFLARMNIYKAEKAFTVIDHHVRKARGAVNKHIVTAKILEDVEL